MVRINLINPKNLADQHLIAEYNEILMLLGYIKRYPDTSLEKIPKNYKLGKGHMLFFKDKLKYIDKRHTILKKEMKRRGFQTNEQIDLSLFNKKLINDWKANSKDKEIIKERLIWKINLKPDYYRYYGGKKTKKFFLDMIKNAR